VNWNELPRDTDDVFFSGFWRRVDSSVDANVSERHTVSIFRAEDGVNTAQNPEEHHHPHRCENLKYHMILSTGDLM
jgi:hypothetical protein